MPERRGTPLRGGLSLKFLLLLLLPQPLARVGASSSSSSSRSVIPRALFQPLGRLPYTAQGRRVSHRLCLTPSPREPTKYGGTTTSVKAASAVLPQPAVVIVVIRGCGRREVLGVARVAPSTSSTRRLRRRPLLLLLRSTMLRLPLLLQPQLQPLQLQQPFIVGLLREAQLQLFLLQPQLGLPPLQELRLQRQLLLLPHESLALQLHVGRCERLRRQRGCRRVVLLLLLLPADLRCTRQSKSSVRSRVRLCLPKRRRR